MTNQPPIWESDPVRFLLELSFPPPSPLAARRSTSGDGSRLSDEAEAYKTSLLALVPDELAAAVTAKRNLIDRLEAMRKTFEPVRQRFTDQCSELNKPSTWPNHFEWAQLAGWHPAEAIALSLNRNPDKITSDSMLRTSNRNTPFGEKYAKRERLIQRAVSGGELYGRISPLRFLVWADRWKVDVPPAMRRAISDLHTDAPNEVAAESLNGKTAGSPEEKGPARESDDDAFGMLTARERNNMLKVIYAMAVNGYRYDPGAKKGDVPKDIATDMELLGFELSVATIRKYLKEAATRFGET